MKTLLQEEWLGGLFDMAQGRELPAGITQEQFAMATWEMVCDLGHTIEKLRAEIKAAGTIPAQCPAK